MAPELLMTSGITTRSTRPLAPLAFCSLRSRRVSSRSLCRESGPQKKERGKPTIPYRTPKNQAEQSNYYCVAIVQFMRGIRPLLVAFLLAGCAFPSEIVPSMYEDDYVTVWSLRIDDIGPSELDVCRDRTGPRLGAICLRIGYRFENFAPSEARLTPPYAQALSVNGVAIEAVDYWRCYEEDEASWSGANDCSFGIAGLHVAPGKFVDFSAYFWYTGAPGDLTGQASFAYSNTEVQGVQITIGNTFACGRYWDARTDCNGRKYG